MPKKIPAVPKIDKTIKTSILIRLNFIYFRAKYEPKKYEKRIATNEDKVFIPFRFVFAGSKNRIDLYTKK